MRRHYSVPTGPVSNQKRYPPFALVQVSHADKLKLFQESISASQKALPQTQDMLAHLRELQPSVAHLFDLKDISISQAPLRFLCERSKQFQLESPPRIKSYIALSYCWHGRGWEVADCLGHPEMGWPVSTAMIHSLLEQRESRDEGIWIDQCCINQQDPLEKRIAIGSMDLLYKSARKVVVILEDVDISEAEKVLLQNIDGEWEPKMADLDALAQVLIRILSARWFNRAWCSHELQLSNDLVFLIAAIPTPVILSPDDLETLNSVTSDHILLREDLTALMVNNVFRSYDIFIRAIDRKAEGSYGRSLISEFSDIHRLACLYQTDVLCIAMNVAGFQIYFTGHLRSSNECRWVLAMVALSAGDATVLDGVEELLSVDDSVGTPSWLNWTNELEKTMTMVGYSKLREPMCIKSIDQYQITLDLLEFTNSTLQHPSAYFYDLAELLVSLLFEIYVNDIPENQPYWMKQTDNPIDGLRERHFVEGKLACSFECGFDWMINQMPSAPDLAKYVQESMDDFESRFWPMLKEHVLVEDIIGSSCLNQLDDDDKKESILLFLHFILFDSFLGLGSLPSFLPARSQAILKDNQVTVKEEDPILVQCLWLDIGSGNKALVASRPGMVERGRLSMPVALSNASCAGTRRLWLLESFPGSENKAERLIEKYRMFTLMPIEENSNVIVRRDQVVRQ